MAWIKVPKKFPYASQGAQAWGSLEYSEEDGLLTGQGLAAADPWIVVPVDLRAPWQKPVAINTARVNQTAGQTFPTHALVARDPDLFLWHDIDNNPNSQSRHQFASWICPVHHGNYTIAMNPGHVGKYRLYFMPLAALPGGTGQRPTTKTVLNASGSPTSAVTHRPQALHPTPVGVTFPLKTLFEVYALEPRVLKVCFNVVEDASGNPSKVKDSDIQVMEFGAEEILNQALVAPVTSSRRLRIKENLGAPVSYLQRNGATIFQTLEQYKNRDADVNAFCVRSYSPARPDFGMEADPDRRMFVIADNVQQSATAFAKALARLAGVKNPNLFRNDARLELAEILQINQFGVRFGATPWH